MALTIKNEFVTPKRYNTWSIALMAVGLLSIIVLFITHGAKTGDDPESLHENARFWAALLHNSVFFLLVTNAVMFFLLKLSTWSFINAINGEITKHIPSFAIAGTW